MRKKAVRARAGLCANCGGRTQLTIDHVIARRDQGSSQRDNLQVLCRACHKLKTMARDKNVAYPPRGAYPLVDKLLDEAGLRPTFLLDGKEAKG